jgi:ATP-dependent DNA helicase RecG
MNEEELRERIGRGEDIHTEFKEMLPVRGDLAKSIVCFANTDGGQIIVGVSNRGEIAGVENLDDAMKLADDVAFNRCEPPVTIIQETVKVEGRPYHTSDGRCYVRATNRCRLASHEELLRLFQATESIYYEESIIYKAAYSDLDLDYIHDFAREYMYLDLESEEIDLIRLLRNLKIMRNEHPTIAGILFFGKKPQNFIPYVRVIGAFIKGTDLSIPPSDKKDIRGKIP